MNFEITRLTPGIVETNEFELVKAELKKDLEKYEGITVTEDSLPICKDIKKDLKRRMKSVDEVRKQLKEDLMAPARRIEEECLELKAIIAEVAEPIEDGIKECTDKLHAEKLERTKDYVQEVCDKQGFPHPEAIEIIDSWGNATKTKKAIVAEIVQQINDFWEKEHVKELRKNTFKTLIEIENEALSTKMSVDEFSDIIDETEDDAVVIKAIKERARVIKSVESKFSTDGEKDSGGVGYLVRVFEDKSTADDVVKILGEHGYFASIE